MRFLIPVLLYVLGPTALMMLLAVCVYAGLLLGEWATLAGR